MTTVTTHDAEAPTNSLDELLKAATVAALPSAPPRRARASPSHHSRISPASSTFSRTGPPMRALITRSRTSAMLLMTGLIRRIGIRRAAMSPNPRFAKSRRRASPLRQRPPPRRTTTAAAPLMTLAAAPLMAGALRSEALLALRPPPNVDHPVTPSSPPPAPSGSRPEWTSVMCQFGNLRFAI